MGTFRKISVEEKSEILKKLKAYLAKGWTLGSAINQVRAEWQDAGRTVPAEMTLRNWMKDPQPNQDADKTNETPAAEAEETAAEAETEAEEPAAEAETGAEEPAAEAEEPAAEEPAADNSDYVRRLELICRLYRGRGDAECDAVCDEILPELFGE